MSISCKVMPCAAPAFSRPGSCMEEQLLLITNTDCVKSSQVFSDDWAIYQKLLDGNYMHHCELYRALQQHIAEQTQGRSFTVLDLGCGDSAHFAKLLRNSPRLANSLAAYTGVDMSLPALMLSASNIRGAVGPQAAVVHHQTDILGFAACPEASWQQFDFVLASFSVHHLSAEEKQQLLELVVGKLLRPGGTFCLVDVFLQAGEQRGDFLLRSKAAYDSLAVFTQEEKNKMLEHTVECDFPESVETVTAWAATQMAQLQVLADYGLFKAVAIQAPAALASTASVPSAA